MGFLKSVSGFALFGSLYILCYACDLYTHIPHEYSTDNFSKPSDVYTCHQTNAIIGSDNGLWPVRHQAVTWTNAV